jgi:coenzyme F420-0:L-glutamate ligase/coenzyme F420-1:gamma-L-glutamate ligase
VREEGGDLFGYGAREAVVRALAGADGDRAPFGSPSTVEELVAALRTVAGRASYDPGPEPAQVGLPPGTVREVVAAVCFAHGWRVAGWSTDAAGCAAHVVPVTP